MDDKEFMVQVIIAMTTVLAEQLDVDRTMRGLMKLRARIDETTHPRATEFHEVIDQVGVNLLDIHDQRAARKKPKH